jgi:hypothetical protein
VKPITEPGVFYFTGDFHNICHPSSTYYCSIQPHGQYEFPYSPHYRSFLLTFGDVQSVMNSGTRRIKVEVERDRHPVHSESLTGVSHMIKELQDHFQTTISNLDGQSTLNVVVFAYDL